jgi:predicted metal-dependent HD superfamily phosphohydrolase
LSLKSRWVGAFRLDAPLQQVDVAGDDLIARWSQPHRRYHTLEHLTRMLDVVDAYGDHADDVDAVRLACWFHDAIYDPTRGDNEDRSASLAAAVLESLGVDAAEVVRLVRLTATHDVTPGDRDGELLADADLAILGADPAVYAAYAEQVRAEYAFVPEPDFRTGRAAILRRFLQRSILYHVPDLRRRWEDQARANIRAEIDALDGADPNE